MGNHSESSVSRWATTGPLARASRSATAPRHFPRCARRPEARIRRSRRPELPAVLVRAGRQPDRDLDAAGAPAVARPRAGWLAPPAGFVVVLQFAPSLILAPFGGVVADRFDKRRALMLDPGAAAGQAFILVPPHGNRGGRDFDSCPGAQARYDERLRHAPSPVARRGARAPAPAANAIALNTLAFDLRPRRGAGTGRVHRGRHRRHRFRHRRASRSTSG